MCKEFLKFKFLKRGKEDVFHLYACHMASVVFAKFFNLPSRIFKKGEGPHKIDMLAY